jgi:diguanylate cyclase (GGDEF)-like protein/PAS domain S-box-containing protein
MAVTRALGAAGWAALTPWRPSRSARNETEDLPMPRATPPSLALQPPPSQDSLQAELHGLGFTLPEVPARTAPAGRDRLMHDAQRWLAAALRSLDEGVLLCEADQRVRFLNDSAERLTGWTQTEAAGVALARVLRLSDANGLAVTPAGPAPSTGAATALPWHLDLQLTGRDGRLFEVDVQVGGLHDDDGLPIGHAVRLRDAATRRQQAARLAASEERFRSLFEHAPGGMALVDLDGCIQQANPALARLLGLGAAQLEGIEHVQLGATEDREFEREQLKRLLKGKTDSVRFPAQYRPRGQRSAQPLRVQVSASLVREAGWPVGFLYQMTDVSDDEQALAERIRATFFDPLTGLGNRARVSEQLELLLATARRERAPVAVVSLDLDRFRHVNDSLGHATGDEVLKAVGERLAATLRASDCIARTSADHFTLVLAKAGTGAHLAQLLEKVRGVICQPLLVAGHELRLSCSLGAAVFPQDGDDAPSLLRAADGALASAQRAGGERLAFFRRDMLASAQARLALEARLREAESRGELRLEFQPIFDLKTRTVQAFEALMRWQCADRLVPPAEFIPVAEECGLIVSLGSWALREACRQAAAWPAGVAVSVNCSAAQFHAPGFVDIVRGALREGGLAPQRLHLELTESVMLRDDEVHRASLDALRQLGVALSVDDYGTGYSSLAYLKHYAPQTLKIDKLFIDEIDSDRASRAIVSATVAMAHKLGMRVVAEGVETQAQLDHLRASGCDAVQGFLLGRPGAAALAAEVIERAALQARAEEKRAASETQNWSLL